jgi:hypothetical protein
MYSFFPTESKLQIADYIKTTPLKMIGKRLQKTFLLPGKRQCLQLSLKITYLLLNSEGNG